jgi:hypothetical protein
MDVLGQVLGEWWTPAINEDARRDSFDLTLR